MIKLFSPAFLQSWGGKEHGYGLAACCTADMRLPAGSTTFYYEYYDTDGVLQCIDPELLHQFHHHLKPILQLDGLISATFYSPGELAYKLCRTVHVHLDDDQRVCVLFLTSHSAILRT